MGKRLVCITGGYGRLGQALAKEFKHNGDQILITGRDEKKLKAAAETIECDSFAQDVTNRQQTERLKEYIEKKYKALDILVNNAALMRSEFVEKMDPGLFKEVLETNLYGPFLSTHTLLPLLKKGSNAIILNIASTSGHRADPGSSAYNASKFGLLGFTEALRKELRKSGIRVTSISPSSIQYHSAPLEGAGVGLNGQDIAKTAVYLTNCPGRTLVRDLEMWATNP